jgi:uncharacterized membrane protein
MRFAVALPWWGYALAFAAALVLAWLAYARVAVALTPRQRSVLTALRAATLLLIVIFLLRPVRLVEAEGQRDSVVAVLVDVSRSMRLQDTDRPRIEHAREIARALVEQLGARFQTELLSFGEALASTGVEELSADARRSDLSEALAAAEDRYRGRRLAGLVVISDGGDTALVEAGSRRPLETPVFAVGVGNPALARDQEVVNLTAGEPLLPNSSVEISASVTSRGLGDAPIELRLTENGRPLETRRVRPSADGAPVHAVFTVSPARDRPTVYALEIPARPGELAVENNSRRVVVPPQGRRRRVLLVEGAPGFEHTFLKRALARDEALEVDSVVRKGVNDEGRDTFFIQAATSRARALAEGYPARRADLFLYDAILFGNIEGEFFTREQLEMTADFVARRGGGLLVFGARSFAGAGLVGTALDEVLPVDLTSRRASVAQAASRESPSSAIALTPDGAVHPATRIALDAGENLQQWERLPPLPSLAVVAAPRAGAQVLATSGGAASAGQPLLVVQRYGVGRTMVFAGEGSWRWRMLRPASDTTHELIWRQMTRWVAAGALERIEIQPLAPVLPGATDTVSVLVRDEEYAPLTDAAVTLHVQPPGGETRVMSAPLSRPDEGRYSASVRFDQPGIYTLTADILRDGSTIGSATRAVLVGGADIEFAEPRLNEAVLRRIAESTGGRYVDAADAAAIPDLIAQADAARPPLQMQDLWHNGVSLIAIIVLLALEWGARRRVGLA